MSNLDDALERFQMGALEYGVGFSNHGTMAAEALEVLGHEALIPNLIDVYAPRLPDFVPGRKLDRAAQQAALGRRERAADWIATFEAELEGEAWPSVLARWLPPLLPGYFAAAAHGPLRTAHAIRSLSQTDSPLRRRELAFGLGYWASYHQALPGSPGEQPVAGQGPAATLARVEPLDEAARVDGLLSTAVRALDGDPAFVGVVKSLDTASGTPSDFVSELCLAAARLYLGHPGSRIAYAHAVTSASALRMLLPHLEPQDQRRALGFALQAAAALHATHGRPGVSDRAAGAAGAGDPSPAGAGAEPGAEVRRAAESIDEIRYRAACSVEEHAIKLTEACLRENAIRAEEDLRLAAADAALEIGASHAARG